MQAESGLQGLGESTVGMAWFYSRIFGASFGKTGRLGLTEQLVLK